ncbi:hypothetical protein DN540_34690, partial [Burkholderia multivorans]
TPPEIGEDPLPGEEVVFDSNQAARGTDFFSLGTFSLTEDGRYLLYGVDTAGDERTVECAVGRQRRVVGSVGVRPRVGRVIEDVHAQLAGGVRVIPVIGIDRIAARADAEAVELCGDRRGRTDRRHHPGGADALHLRRRLGVRDRVDVAGRAVHRRLRLHPGRHRSRFRLARRRRRARRTRRCGLGLRGASAVLEARAGGSFAR